MSRPPPSAAGGGRWDAERFMREREERDERYEAGSRRAARAPPVLERERERAERRAPNFDDYLRSDDRFAPPTRRPDVSDALVPYEERVERDRDLDREVHREVPLAPPPGPRRPTLLRRQSSLDTFDRAAQRRHAHNYYDYDREDYGPPVTPVPLPRRKRSPPRYHEVHPEDFSDFDLDEVRVAEPDYYGDEEFRTIRPRARSVTPRGRERSMFREEIVEREKTYPRRGKTRVPKRLAHPRALFDLGYEYEDEGGTILITQALGKEHIDKIVEYSKVIRSTPRGVSIGEREKITLDPGRELSVERRRSKSRRREVVQTVGHVEHSPSTPRSMTPISRPRRRRRSSPIRIVEDRETIYDDVIEPRADVALVLPDRTRRTDRDIRDEIRALEAERRMLRLERGTPPEDEEVIEVRRRDPKAPSPGLIRAMLATLT